MLTWDAGPHGTPAGLRRARGAVGRPARPRHRRARPAAHARPAGRRGRRRAATGCWSWSRRRWPASRRPPGCAPASPTVRRCGWWSAAPASEPRDVARVDRRRRWSPRCPTSAGWPSRSTSGSGRCARGAGRSGRAGARGARRRSGRCRPRHDTSCRRLPADVVDAVRDRLARRPGALTPHRVAEALREAGRPVGDATVLAVHEALRRDVVGAGPLEPLLRTPGRHRRARQRRRRGLPRPRRRARADRRSRFPDDEAVRRLAQRLAALGRSAPRRRHAVRRRAAARRHPVPRRARAGRRGPGTADLAAGAAAARASPSTSWSPRGTLTDEGARLLRAVVRRRLAFLVSGGTGSGKTTLLAALLVAGRRRTSGSCWSRTPPSCGPTTRTSSRSRRGRANIEGAGAITLRDPGPAGAADAARPAGRRRGARRRGGRAAGRAQHRPRGRLRHPPRQLGRRRAGPGRGAGPGRRARPRRRAQPARLGRRRRAPPGPPTPTARARLRAGGGAGARRRRAGHDARRRSSSPTTARTGPGPAPTRLAGAARADDRAGGRWRAGAGGGAGRAAGTGRAGGRAGGLAAWSAPVARRRAGAASCSGVPGSAVLAVLAAGVVLGGAGSCVRRRSRRRAAAQVVRPGCSRPASCWPPSSPPASRPAARSTGPPRPGRRCARSPRRHDLGGDVPAALRAAGRDARRRRPAPGRRRLAGRPPHRARAGRRRPAVRRLDPGRPRDPRGSSRASWPRPGPPPGWSPGCRCWPC